MWRHSQKSQWKWKVKLKETGRWIKELLQVERHTIPSLTSYDYDLHIIHFIWFTYENVRIRFTTTWKHKIIPFFFCFSILTFKTLFLSLEGKMIFKALHNESTTKGCVVEMHQYILVA